LKRKVLWWFFAVVLQLGSLEAGEIKVAVAANVSYAIDDLKKAFSKIHPHIKVQTILGSSGKLTAQIRHGAPFDMFMSADMKFPQKLKDEGLAASRPVVYAQGALAILSVKKRNYCAEMFVLKDPDIKKIAIANPKTAPYGKAAKEALEHEKLYEKVKDKLVFGESISQTVAFTTKAADIGIVAKSSLFSPQMSHYKEAIHWTEVDTNLYRPIDQGMVILKRAKDNTDVKAFYDFILSREAKVILQEYGYKVK
jgi:molybdate transport system substrate-binding protein